MILEDLCRFGLVSENVAGMIRERVIPNENGKADSGQIPKVDPNLPQSDRGLADVGKPETDNAGDQNKNDDPTDKADERNQDKMMKSVVTAAQALEYALENMCETCEKGYTEYDDDMKTKLHEYYESARTISQGMYELANMESY